MTDIRAFFSPHGGKSKINTSNNGVNETPSREEKSKLKSNKKKPRLSTSPEIKKSKNKGSGGEAKKSGAKRAIVISESDDDDDFVKKKQKKPKRSQTSDSDEDPIPQDIRKSATKTNKQKTGPSKARKSTYFDESDEEDEEAPIKLPKSAEKTNKAAAKSNTKDAPQIQETPVKHMTSASDFFGSAPVQRSAQKKLSTKRKQPLEDTPEKKDSNSVSPSKTAAGVDSHPKEDEQPIKKRKEVKSPKKSPAKEKKTLAGKLSKAAAAYLSVPDTPPSGTTEKQEKPQPTASPIKTVKESPKKTPEKPKEKTEEEPPSLEKKKSSYRSFMQRDGPRSLGTREIPQGADNCFEGMTFVITGVLETIEREEAQHIIQRCGGKVTQAVSKKTAYVIVGRDPGLSKTSKAEKLGTKMINEDEFYELVKTTPGKKSSYDPSPEKPPSKKPKISVSDSPLTKKSPAKIVNESPLSSQGESSGSQKSVSDSPLTKTSSTKVTNKSPLSSQGEASCSQTSLSSIASVTKPSNDSPSSQKSLAASAATKTPSGSTVKGESLMWVDKYKPSTIKQIIGQQGEKSNMRKLMNWIKNWHINRTKKHPKTSFFQKDQDGAIFKAALLSGPPGVGKTTTSVLVCQELGYSYVEMNASDARNKKCLQEHVLELLSNKSIDAFVEGSKGSPKDSSKHVLIMDEVDGMAGNEDRGGMQELISLIKNTKIPIICMCNDRNSQKIRSLVNYCFDLRFQRPRVEQIKGAMMSIAFKEGLKIPPPAMDQIIIGANQDIRQVLHNLSMWTSTNKIMTYDQAKTDANKAHKDIKMGPFDAIRKLLSSAESSKLSLIDKSDLFFCDYSLMPLFVQQNYLDVRPAKGEGNINKILKLVSKTADSISDGDLVEKNIRSNGHWSLLPTQAMFSSVIPSHFISGVMGQRIEFPQWLGKNSKKGRLDRILQELQTHMRLRTSSGKACVNLDYVPHLRKALTGPLMDEAKSKEGVSRVISLLDAYDLTREDWDSIMEAGQYEGHRDPMTKIPSKVKAAFTRAYNKDQHKKPYALKGPPAKSRGKSSNIDMDYEGAEDELEDEEEEESIENSAMIVKNKNSAATKGKGGKKTTRTKRKRQRQGKKCQIVTKEKYQNASQVMQNESFVLFSYTVLSGIWKTGRRIPFR